MEKLREGVDFDMNIVSDSDSQPLVTVVCITYGHEEFIAQALDSFISQKTTFPFQVFVGEDCGPDGTARIVEEYAAKYPGLVVPYVRKENMGAQRNLIDLCRKAGTRYIAFCEGDDYWIDDLKLQKQFDYMEAHPDCRVCTARTKIIAPEDWHLRSWYKPTGEGDLVIPDSIPGYKSKAEYTPAEIIGTNVAHTSTHFYRWDNEVIVPDWYYEGIIGDTPLLLLQLGESNLAVLPDIVSVYRINEGSIFFDKDREAHFLRTRLDYVRYLSGLYGYAEEHFQNYPLNSVRNRIKVESANYLRVAVSRDDDSAIQRLFDEYPFAAKCFLESAVPDFFDQRSITEDFGWSLYKLYARDKGFRRRVFPFVRLYRKCKAFRGKIRKAKRKVFAFSRYWRYTFSSKDKNLWVFSGFKKNSYIDNTKYLYEYVVEYHPEIRAVWLTNSKLVERRLNLENMPVARLDSAEGRRLVSHASVAFIDHFRMSDLGSLDGMNDRLKIVQLWHGVGLKSIGDLRNTDVAGVRFSDDIIPSSKDTLGVKLIKKVKYLFCAPFRELFEKYFILVCPGEERALQVADPWHVPRSACLYAGHPRNILLHTAVPCEEPKRVLYAPTYRWDAKSERRMIDLLLNSASAIQRKMDELGAELTVRLHPHTWRSYKGDLARLAEEHDRIKIDDQEDIYETLGRYSVLISDYSSIAYDFVLIDRPIVFFAFDLEEFTRRECNLNYGYDEYSPGFHASTWEDALACVEKYLADSSIHEDWRRSVRDEFYVAEANDERNSERIVAEVKRRLEDSCSA